MACEFSPVATFYLWSDHQLSWKCFLAMLVRLLRSGCFFYLWDHPAPTIFFASAPLSSSDTCFRLNFDTTLVFVTNKDRLGWIGMDLWVGCGMEHLTGHLGTSFNFYPDEKYSFNFYQDEKYILQIPVHASPPKRDKTFSSAFVVFLGNTVS